MSSRKRKRATAPRTSRPRERRRPPLEKEPIAEEKPLPEPRKIKPRETEPQRVEVPKDLPIDHPLASIRKIFAPLLATFVERTKGDEHNRIVFVSPDHDAGTTTLATCAAIVLVRNFRTDVALIEANLYSPAMASYMGLPAAPGLLDVADGRVAEADAIRNSQVNGLYVLAAGSQRLPEEGEVASPVLRELLKKTASEHRYTLIDAPPILEYPETCTLLEEADEVILVTRAGSTSKKRAQAAIQMIRDAGVRVSGVFLNHYQPHRPFGIGGG